MQHVVVLTGAGISAESGLRTFRDSDGLWEGYDVSKVATPQGFEVNPELVLRFYNERRNDILIAQPNEAHKLLAQLQEKYNVTIITQNIDDLHERAGSKHIIHLHGQITKMRSVLTDATLYPYDKDITVGELAEDGTQLRPHIVWFGEAVPKIEEAIDIIQTADIVVIIGTSLQVYPAAGLVNYAPANTPIYVIDKVIPPINNPQVLPIQLPATAGVAALIKLL